MQIIWSPRLFTMLHADWLKQVSCNLQHVGKLDILSLQLIVGSNGPTGLID